MLLDGGIRRGSDVVKAVALGARAVMIGRAYLWGLAANGQAGVENVLDILRGGIDSALMGIGHASIHDLMPGRHAGPGRLHPRARRPSSRTPDRPPAHAQRAGTDVADGTGVANRLPVAKNSRKSIAAHAPTIGVRQVNSAYHRRVAFPSELGNSTSRQLQSTSPALIVPVGSTEQHGPHLPLDTDTRIATAVARAVAGRLPWRCAPLVLRLPIGYGASGEHQGFAGTVSIGTAALRLLLLEFGRSAARWASRLVFVNGHGGNVEALGAAVALLRGRRSRRRLVLVHRRGADAHAGHTETSVLLHISPKDVWIDERLAGNSAPLAELMPSMRRGGVAAVSEWACSAIPPPRPQQMASASSPRWSTDVCSESAGGCRTVTGC